MSELQRMTVTGWSPEQRAAVRYFCAAWLERHPDEDSEQAAGARYFVALIDEVNAAEGVMA